MLRNSHKRPQSLRLLSSLAAVCCTLGLAPQQVNAEPRPDAWEQRYQRAREALLRDHDEEAATEFERLATETSDPEQRRLARELASIARVKLQSRAKVAPNLRKTDELSLLYTSAFIYGLGTSTWVALLTQPKTLGSAILPFAALTTAAVGSVAVADDYRPFRRGVPQSISIGLYLGLGEAMWVVAMQHAWAKGDKASSRWQSEQVATLLWSGATLGGIGGGVLGALREPTAGRVSFTASTTLWGGLLGGFAAAALEPAGSRRTETALLSGAIGYNAGLLGGVIFAPMLAPSVARVRFVDLGGVGGGLIGAGTYALLAGDSARTHLSLGSAAIGAALGLGLTWFATDDMPGDPPRAARLAPSATLTPLLVPSSDAWLAGVSGEF